jgi:8-oxo-dGTP pyrophosphatase MutT (NUDIX family)
MELERAAGGLVWRHDGAASRLAIIHRPRRDDWSLPKGRLDRGEPWHAAAAREVAEETGCQPRLSRFAGAKLFLDRRVPKLVLYWHMRALSVGELDDPDEVDAVAWLSPRDALARLDHGSDRRLLLRALAGGGWRKSASRAVRGEGDARGAALRRVLVVHGRCRDEQLAPFLRVLDKAVAGGQRRAAPGRLAVVR